MGVGHRRFTRIHKSAVSGEASCPIDSRYISGLRRGPKTEKRSEVYVFLFEMYESVAETLPEDAGGEESSGKVVVGLKIDPSALGEDPYVQTAKAMMVEKHRALTLEKRFLPPGSIYELWRQFQSVTGQRCSWRTFYLEWVENWAGVPRVPDNKTTCNLR